MPDKMLLLLLTSVALLAPVASSGAGPLPPFQLPGHVELNAVWKVSCGPNCQSFKAALEPRKISFQELMPVAWSPDSQMGPGVLPDDFTPWAG
jgi:hypothetical protein